MSRKEDHIEICQRPNVQANHDYWDDLSFVHNAVPEMDMDEIALRTRLFGKPLQAPIVIAAMTGGTPKAEVINKNLAAAAAQVGVAMGVGSQRAGLEDPALAATYEVVKEFDVPLVFGNVGAPQLVARENRIELEHLQRAMEMVDADVMALHLNFVQEVAQPEGDTKAKGVLAKIKQYSSMIPIIAKETGAGISRQTAIELKDAGVKGFDVGGMSGTSFSAVEALRAAKVNDKTREQIGNLFKDWGIPTPVSVLQTDVGLPRIATGGIRHGLDAARALALGADAAGMAAAFLAPALESKEAVVRKLEQTINEVKAVMLLTGAKDLENLRSRQLIATGPLREWLQEI